MGDFVDDRLGVLHEIVAGDDALVPVQVGSHPLLSVLGRAQLRDGVEQPQQRPVPVERRHVEQQLPRLEREQEGARRGDLLEPQRQVGGHDDDGVLQLPVHLGRQLRVDELGLAQDGLVGSKDSGVLLLLLLLLIIS